MKVTSPLDVQVTHGHLCIKGRFGFEFVHGGDLQAEVARETEDASERPETGPNRRPDLFANHRYVFAAIMRLREQPRCADRLLRDCHTPRSSLVEHNADVPMSASVVCETGDGRIRSCTGLARAVTFHHFVTSDIV